MAIILNIETATKNCSVSLSKDGETVEFKEFNDGSYSHAEVLHSFCLDVVNASTYTLQDIDAFAVSKGPGSYTGLRIGVSAIKGFCFALQKPLIAVDTLTSLAHAISIEKGVIIPLIDARRMEVYAAVYNQSYQQIRATKAVIIDENSFGDYLEHQKVYFLGDGAMKCKDVIKHQNAIVLDSYFPSAKEMSKLSYQKYINNDFEDVAYFEPFYLKDFIVVPEKKKFL